MIINDLYNLFTKREKKKLIFIFSLSLITSIIDVIGIASILPFIAILSNPEIIKNNIVINSLYELLKINEQAFTRLFGLVFLLIYSSSIIIKAITLYVQLNFILMQEYDLTKRIINGYLNQDYAWYLKNNTSNLTKNILSEVNLVINQGLMPAVSIITHCMVVLSLFALLIIVSPKLALITASTLIFMYAITALFFNKVLGEIGKGRQDSLDKIYVTIKEAFGGIKEIKAHGLEDIYLNKFSKPAKAYAKQMTLSASIAQLPRYVLEGIAFTGILILLIYLVEVSGSMSTTLPVISLYALAGYRIMPALQQIYASFSQIKVAKPAVKILVKDLNKLQENRKTTHEKNIFSLNESIEFKNISFSYTGSSKKILKNINLRLPANKIIGIIGLTGSGKSTLIDILCGIVNPTSGTIEVDGKILNSSNVDSWKKIISYVPQNIFLSDSSIMENIAFGVPVEDINKKSVEISAEIACINGFIKEKLTNGYQTNIGEGGIRLSGGERQRVGIARGLYRNSKLIVLDESTSALDNLTESNIFKNLIKLKEKYTIIIVGHRLNLLNYCDQIIILDSGEVKSQGSFKEIQNNHYYQNLAKQ